LLALSPFRIVKNVGNVRITLYYEKEMKEIFRTGTTSAVHKDRSGCPTTLRTADVLNELMLWMRRSDGLLSHTWLENCKPVYVCILISHYDFLYHKICALNVYRYWRNELLHIMTTYKIVRRPPVPKRAKTEIRESSSRNVDCSSRTSRLPHILTAHICFSWTPICKNKEVRDALHKWRHKLPKIFFVGNTRNIVERRNKCEGQPRDYYRNDNACAVMYLFLE
jgi:hypothetical protein